MVPLGEPPKPDMLPLGPAMELDALLNQEQQIDEERQHQKNVEASIQLRKGAQAQLLQPDCFQYGEEEAGQKWHDNN